MAEGGWLCANVEALEGGPRYSFRKEGETPRAFLLKLWVGVSAGASSHEAQLPPLPPTSWIWAREGGGAGCQRGTGAAQGDLAPRLCVCFFPRYWDDFHACTLTALTDCQEGATDLWEKLKRESKNLDFQGSLFELCGGSNGSAPSLLFPALPVLLVSLSAALVTWLSF